MPKFKINFDWLKATLMLGLIAFFVLFSLQQLALFLQVNSLNLGVVFMAVFSIVWIGQYITAKAAHNILYPTPPKPPKKAPAKPAEAPKGPPPPPKEPEIDIKAIKESLLKELSFSEELGGRLSNYEVKYINKLFDEVAQKSAEKAIFNAKKGFSDSQKNDKDALETKIQFALFRFFLYGIALLTAVIFILFHFKTGIELIKNFL